MSNNHLALNEGQDYTTFHIGELFFGIPAIDVVELSRNLEVTSVPKGPAYVSGLMNLRGQLVPAVDMHIRLGINDGESDARGVSIILSSNGAQVALIVDSVGEILSLNSNFFEPPPNKLTALAKEVVLGVYKLPDRLLLILDPVKIVENTSLDASAVAN
jgi:purine-binding chemotaxis protein CheW